MTKTILLSIFLVGISFSASAAEVHCEEKSLYVDTYNFLPNFRFGSLMRCVLENTKMDKDYIKHSLLKSLEMSKELLGVEAPNEDLIEIESDFLFVKTDMIFQNPHSSSWVKFENEFDYEKNQPYVQLEISRIIHAPVPFYLSKGLFKGLKLRQLKKEIKEITEVYKTILENMVKE